MKKGKHMIKDFVVCTVVLFLLAIATVTVFITILANSCIERLETYQKTHRNHLT